MRAYISRLRLIESDKLAAVLAEREGGIGTRLENATYYSPRLAVCHAEFSTRFSRWRAEKMFHVEHIVITNQLYRSGMAETEKKYKIWEFDLAGFGF